MTIFIGFKYLRTIKRLSLIVGIMLVVGVLAACTSHPNNPAYSQIKKCFDEAVAAQKTDAYHDAIRKYKHCIDECSAGRYADNDSVKLLLPKAMVQLMNTYQSLGQLNDCISYFDSLRTVVSQSAAPHQGLTKGDRMPHHSNVLTTLFKRDVYILLAYSLSRTEAVDSAARLMDVALQMPLSYPSNERSFRDYAYATGVYYCVPSEHDKVLEYGNLALSEVKHCANKSGAQWLVACLGKMYLEMGDVGKSIGLYREGYEIAEQGKDTLGMANAKNLLADFLLRWKLYDEADRYASDAVKLVNKMNNPNPMVKTNVYINKVKVLLANGQLQEALDFLNDAKRICKDLPYNSGMSDVELLMGKVLAKKGDIAKSLNLLDKVSHSATFSLKAQAFFEMAKGRLKEGDEARGELALDSMYAVLNHSDKPLFIDGAYNFALDYYISRGNTSKIALYAAAAKREKMAREENEIMKSVTQSLVRMEMEKQRKMIEEKEAQMERRKLLDIFVISIMAIWVVIGFIYFRKKRKESHAKNLITHQQLSETLKKLDSISEDKEHVERQLVSISEDKKKIERRLRRLQREDILNKAKNLDKTVEGVSLTDVMKQQGDGKFKEAFSRSYPHFLKDLRAESQHITAKEEIYCMLIALGQTNLDISELFNVTRSSVIIAKYRLRKKLPLEEEQSMEAYLEGMLAREQREEKTIYLD